MFVYHGLNLLRAMKCQTSPGHSFMKYGKADKHIDLDFSGDGGILYFLSSTLLFWEGDADSCLAVDMIPSKTEVWDRKGSLSLLWPLFQALCVGQFVETLSCALQGRPLMTETGMSIFEHSLAFAEAEGMLSNTLGLSPFGLPRAGSGVIKSKPEEGLMSRNALFYKLNTPPEVLLMGFISSLNNLSSQILGVLDMQSRFRLMNTGIWGLCFMGAFVWGFFSVRPESGPDNIILRFPTVCIVGFIPHLLILIGIVLCAVIYSLAVLLCFFSPPSDLPRPQHFMDRVRWAHENMQATAQLSSLRLNMHEDFYTVLLKVGFTALTIASEAVYLNEGQRISVARWTWLEEERMKEIEAFAQSNGSSRRLAVHLEDPHASASDVTDQTTKPWVSGYSRQTSVKAAKSGPRLNSQRVGADGVGHLQRGGRYFMAYEFFEGIFWLFTGWLKLLLNVVLDKIGISRRPQWLRSSNRKEGKESNQRGTSQNTDQEPLPFWLLSNDGVLSLPENDDVDVEQETRGRLQHTNDSRHPTEEALSKNLYDWWKHGGWWGEKDESGSYHSPPQDDDTTSLISISTAENETDDDTNPWENASLSSGPPTPTQSHPHPHHSQISPLSRSRSPTPSPDTPLQASHLASLLDPKTSAARQEAKMLAHHLTAPNITTRSRYAHAQNHANAHLLTSTRFRPPGMTSGPLSPDEEALLLEQLIISRRQTAPRSPQTGQPDASTWSTGAAGLGSSGPQCVVCQSAPRTVLAWPCRCLSLCEECRVSLAMNNFGTCVCCRQDVVGFSRLFVP